MKTIRLRTSKKALYSQLRSLPEEIVGKRSDSELSKVFLNHLGHTLFERVETSFLDKSSGGTDEFGKSWKPLTPETIAARPISNTEYRKAGVRQGERGILTVFQNAIWKGIFASTYKRARAEYDDARAKQIAGETAWAVIKSLGGKTKLGVFGRRKVRILRVSDRLYESLKAGTLVNNRYYPPKEQVFEIEGAELVLGTKVPYAKNVSRRRPVLPTATDIQKTGLLSEAIGKATRGLIRQLEVFLKKRSPSDFRRYRRSR